MKKTLPYLAFMASFNALGEPMEYESIVNMMQIDAQGKVRLSVLLKEENDEILCNDNGYHFGFELSNAVMDKWYDSLMLARSSNSFLNFHYEQYSNNNCELTAITFPKLYERGTDPGEDPSTGLLKETGNYGNIALIGTNGLSSDSFSSSEFYGQDAPQAAFDGYIYSEKSNADASDKVARGIWLVKKTYTNGVFQKPWIQVDFGKEVPVLGTRIFINKKSMELGRNPRNVTVQVSSDGEEFTTHEKFVLPSQEITSTAFSAPATARYFRLLIETNNGDANFIEIDEWEFYQEK